MFLITHFMNHHSTLFLTPHHLSEGKTKEQRRSLFFKIRSKGFLNAMVFGEDSSLWGSLEIGRAHV